MIIFDNLHIIFVEVVDIIFYGVLKFSKIFIFLNWEDQMLYWS